MALQKGLGRYEFKRSLLPSKDLPHYWHIKNVVDSDGTPQLLDEGQSLNIRIKPSIFFGLNEVDETDKAQAPTSDSILTINSKLQSKLEVEIGCGKGSFMVAYCERHPEVAFVGLEKDPDIAFLTARRIVKRKNLKHARVVCGDAFYFIRDCLPQNSVNAFHMYFPDPWPKKRQKKKRLLKSDFLHSIQQAAIPGALFHWGTDHEEYHQETLEVFKNTVGYTLLENNVEATEGIRTNFEKKWIAMGKPIYRCIYQINKA